MKKVFTILLMLTILIIPQLGCNAQENNQGIEKTGFYLDTVCRITIYSMEGTEGMSDEEKEKEALLKITEAFKICDGYEKKLSRTIEGSDIYNINHAGGKAVTVDEETVRVIRKGIEFGDLSGGAFDITIGRVSDLWNFHEEDEEGNKAGTLPDENELAEAVSHVDYTKIEVEGNTVRLLDSEAEIDLGGIAKGYIADKVAQYLEEQGVTSAVVDLGGNIVTIGEKGKSLEDGSGSEFVIGIADPAFGRSQLLGTIPCRDKTLVTSGTYERYFEIDGKKYHHVLDPRTGYPKDTDLLSVTVIGGKGHSVDCDGLSTACLALGLDDGLKLIQGMDGVEAVFVTAEGKVHLSDDELNFNTN